MRLLPLSRFGFDSDLTPDDVRGRLERIVAKAETDDGRPLMGTVLGDTFELRSVQRPLHRVPYLATVRARIVQVGERSHVEGSITASTAELVIVAILVVSGVVTGFLQDRAGIVFALAMAAFYHVGGMMFGFRPSRDSLIRTVLRALGQAKG